MINRGEIIKAIIDTIVKEIGGFDPVTLAENTSLTYDLKIETDDISFLLVPAIERQMGKGLPGKTWARVHTIGEIADAFANQ